jgi:hypothetical protein
MSIIEVTKNLTLLFLSAFILNYNFYKFDTIKKVSKLASNYLIASSVQFIITILYIFYQENSSQTMKQIANLMIAYFIFDLIYIKYICEELYSKVLVAHHIVSGFLVWIGCNFGDNPKYIMDIFIACETANIWDNLLYFSTYLNLINKSSYKYKLFRIMYIVHFSYDRLYNLPNILNEFLKVSNIFETYSIYCIYTIIIPMSLRLSAIKTLSLIKSLNFY